MELYRYYLKMAQGTVYPEHIAKECTIKALNFALEYCSDFRSHIRLQSELSKVKKI